MNAEQEKWVRTLETTERKRGKGKLYKDSDNSFSCLGIYAADSACRRRINELGCTEFEGEVNVLSKNLMCNLGLNSVNGEFRDTSGEEIVLRLYDVEAGCLTQLNDKLPIDLYPTFKEIAQFIRENEQYIFVQEK